jgi:riboflavin transporter FmnP
MKNKKTINLSTEKTVGIAIFSALAFVVSLIVRFTVQFLTFDAKDAVITIAAFVYGPLAGVIISFLAAFIELITISTTGWYGFIMNFASSAVFALTASLIYTKKRNLNGALIGLYSAIAATVGVMILLNLFVTPLYLQYVGAPITNADMVAMLPGLLLPFNFAKSLMNSAIVMLLYKPLVVAMKRLNILKSQGGKAPSMTFNKATKIILVLGAVGLVISITIFLILIL